MTSALQETLVALFSQVAQTPDVFPTLPLESWPEDSEERRVLVHFHTMLASIQRSKQQAIDEKEAQYRSIFEGTVDGILITTLDGIIVEANPATCTLFGYSYEELLGLHYTQFTSPEIHRFVGRYLRRIQRGEQLQTQSIGIRKDGTRFYAEVHGKPFLYKGQPHILSAVHDITERKQAEEQLKEKEAQYRSIFESTNDSFVITDLQNIIVEVNPAACRLYDYSYEELIGKDVTSLVHPDYLPLLPEYGRKLLQNRLPQSQLVCIRKDGTLIHIEVQGSVFTYKGQPHIITGARDITERIRAEEQLKEKEAQYRSIFEATSEGFAISNMETGMIVEANPAMCKMFGYDYEQIIELTPSKLIDADSLPHVAEGFQRIREGLDFHTQAVAVHKNGTLFPIESDATPFTYRGKPHSLTVIRDITERVQAYQLLEQRVEERTRELSALLEVSHNVASTLEVKRLLQLILDQVKVLVDYTGASILLVEDEEFVLAAYQGYRSDERLLHRRFSIKQVELGKKIMIVDDIWGNTDAAREFRSFTSVDSMEATFLDIRSWMSIPMQLKDRVIGIVTVASGAANYYTPRHAALAQAIADQAAVAIENAHLYEQAQELAAFAERQRLARELHDSVSQALYGITLGAHTARTLLTRDPNKVAEPLDYVLSLADAALAEMRALIFELRPETLEIEGLVTSLTKQAAAMRVRHHLAVSTDLCEEPTLPLKSKRELHRVAQEALHNIVKHASADRVELHLVSTTKGVMLEVHDNGKGFDLSDSFPGHLGLQSMHERMERLGGTLHIESQSASGTTIRAWLPIPVE